MTIDFITGDKFKALGDYVYAPDVKKDGDYDNLVNTLDCRLLEDHDIVYTHTMYAKQLFGVIESVDKKLIIITHNSDMNIDESFILPDNVIKWYAQNVNVINPRIKSIPIGLENDRWFTDIHKKEKMIAKLREPRNYRNLVYMNHNISTNPAKRLIPYGVLENKPWVTPERGVNGHRFDEYLDNIYNHKFVVCPEGNGIDTHRIWECLYMGSIPIVENNISAELLYSYFPCCIAYDGWGAITDNRLYGEFKEIQDIKTWFDGADMLTFEYWKNKITGK